MRRHLPQKLFAATAKNAFLGKILAQIVVCSMKNKLFINLTQQVYSCLYVYISLYYSFESLQNTSKCLPAAWVAYYQLLNHWRFTLILNRFVIQPVVRIEYFIRVQPPFPQSHKQNHFNCTKSDVISHLAGQAKKLTSIAFLCIRDGCHFERNVLHLVPRKKLAGARHICTISVDETTFSKPNGHYSDQNLI